MALDFFYELRAAGLRKKPATAELLNWLTTLLKIFPEAETKAELTEEMLLKTALGCLAKQEEDMVKAKKVIEKWLR